MVRAVALLLFLRIFNIKLLFTYILKAQSQGKAQSFSFRGNRCSHGYITKPLAIFKCG